MTGENLKPITPEFGGLCSNNHSEAAWNSTFWLLNEDIKYQNSTITCPMWIKLGRDMYHLNTFNLHQNEGASSERGGGGGGAGGVEGVYKKPSKNAIKLT